MMLPVRGSKAFTLLELIVVIVILGILAAIAIPTFQKVIEKSKDNSAKQTLQALDREAQALAAFDNVPADETHYAAAAEDLNAFQAGLSAAGTYTVATSETEAAAGSKLGLKVAEGTVGVSLLSGSGNCVTLRNAAGTVTIDVKRIAPAECTGATAWLATGTAAPAPAPTATTLTLAGTVTTYVGTGTAGAVDGTGTKASVNSVGEMVAVGEHLYVADRGNHKIRKIVIATGEVTTFAGSPTNTAGSADGVGTAATFNTPWGITSDGTDLYVVDSQNHTIRKISIATQQVTTLAGSAGAPGLVDGTGGTARFSSPIGSAFGNGKLYVADRSNNKIRVVDPATGSTTTLAPALDSVRGLAFSADGASLYAMAMSTLYKVNVADSSATPFGNDAAQPYNNAYQLAVNGTNLYVADLSNHKVKKVDLTTGAVSLVAGSGTAGTVDGTGAGASFNYPLGVAAHSTGLYVSEHLGHVIRKIQ